MDLDELLSYKPNKKTGDKRPLEEDKESKLPLSKAARLKLGDGIMKGSKYGDGRHTPLASLAQGPGNVNRQDLNGISDEEKLRLLNSLDDKDDDPGEVLDAGIVKQMLLSFEKKVLKNQEMRVKFPDMPEKFMESELELNDEVQKLHVIATVPEHYTILVETNVIQTVLGLISHDNSDISTAVIDFLQELTDEGAMSDDDGEEVEVLVDALLAEGVVALLVDNLDRLDEKVKEDFDGVHNTLAIIENMCEVRNSEVCQAGGKQGLLTWLLKRVRVRQYDNNKLYAAEVLAILLQGNTENQQFLGERDGIDILLQSLAYYKRRDPGSVDEIEMMENLFGSLCSALMYTPNLERFLKGEGLQLMILMLKERKMSQKSALKVLNHAMSNKEGKDNCIKFVEVYGLRSLFPSFMKTPKKILKAGGSEMEHEEHVCSIIVSLFKNIKGPHRERIINKFVENDHEKVERLMELHFKYQRRVREADLRIESQSEESEMEIYVRRLDAGLFILQMVDYIIAELNTCPTTSIGARIEKLLNQHGDSLRSVKQTLLEQAENIGDDLISAEGTNGTMDKGNSAPEKAELLALADSIN